MKKILLPLSTVLTFLFFVGCSAIQTSIEFADLEISGNTQQPVFIRNPQSQKLFLIVDCPIKEWASIPTQIAQGYENKGYAIVTKREDADLIMAVQVHNANDVQKRSARAMQGGRDGTAGAGAIAGTGVGYLISKGDPVSTVASTLGGLTVGALTDFTINSWVYLGVLEVKGDILVIEKGKTKNKNNWWTTESSIFKETETAVTVRAKQAGLTWDKSSGPIGAKFTELAISVLPEHKKEL